MITVYVSLKLWEGCVDVKQGFHAKSDLIAYNNVKTYSCRSVMVSLKGGTNKQTDKQKHHILQE